MIPHHLLSAMQCGRPLINTWAAGDFWDGLFCGYLASGLSMGALALIVTVPVAWALQTWSQSYIAPIVWLTLVSGIIVGVLPGEISQLVVSITIVGTLITFIVIWRMAER